ncbi:hypothetical protein GTP45_27545 [Pseudoduganella sp. FT55W]|uniref:Phage tail fibre protein N-terminal domain-containing protein n=1 Tax=Duganella rivi TaxID=2666083 RepID=A0A7X4KF01_9BURK|nr:phage tail protein [Duganella rivi]MYM70537.1 hypothetical protein [Duganella rivi]
MSQTYYSLITAAGLAELADAQVAREVVPFTHIAIGDGNGHATAPDENTAGLVNKVYQVEISSIKKDPTHPTWFIFEAAVPEDVGGWTARELALIGGRVPGKVMAVSNYPAVEKVAAADGSARAMIVRFYMEYVNGAVISLSVNPQAYATAQSVLQSIADHMAALDPHPQYLTKAEADAFYDTIGLAADAIQQDAARLSSHIAAADPHPQYVNGARAAAANANRWAEEFFNAAG